MGFLAGNHQYLMKLQSDIHGWKQEDSQVFWSSIAPDDHVVQIYENDEAFQDLLDNFVMSGIRAGESVIVIATLSHLETLNESLRKNGYDPFHLKIKGVYIPLDARESLSKFMVNHWPDENLFLHFVNNALMRARSHSHNVRVMGEMVALLWAQGLTEATARLESLWDQFRKKQSFSLLCAYPKSILKTYPESSLNHIYCSHKKVVNTADKGSNEILYKEIA